MNINFKKIAVDLHLSDFIIIMYHPWNKVKGWSFINEIVISTNIERMYIAFSY